MPDSEHGNVPKPAASSPAPRAGRDSGLKPVAHGPGTAAHGSGPRARGAAGIGPGLGSLPSLSGVPVLRQPPCCPRCHGCCAGGASPAAAAVTSLLPLLHAGTEAPSGISCAWGVSLRGKSLAVNSSERHRLTGASAWIETAPMALSNISLWIRGAWAVGE